MTGLAMVHATGIGWRRFCAAGGNTLIGPSLRRCSAQPSSGGRSKLYVDRTRAGEVNPEAEIMLDKAAIMEASFEKCSTALRQACETLFLHDVFIDLHAPVYTCEQAALLTTPRKGAAEMKNLFIVDKRKRFFLVSALIGTEVKLNKLTFAKSARFASAEHLFARLGVLPGSVTPFGLINDKCGEVEFYLDRNVLEKYEMLAVHPNSCAATVTIHKDDFVKFIEKVARHRVHILEV